MYSRDIPSLEKLENGYRLSHRRPPSSLKNVVSFRAGSRTGRPGLDPVKRFRSRSSSRLVWNIYIAVSYATTSDNKTHVLPKMQLFQAPNLASYTTHCSINKYCRYLSAITVVTC